MNDRRRNPATNERVRGFFEDCGYAIHFIHSRGRLMEMAKGKSFLAERSKPFFTLVLAILFIVASASLAISQTSQYQSIKGVKFKDGTVVMGTVTQLNVETVTIRLDNGQTIVRKFDDVDTFIKRDDAVITVQETTPAVPSAAVAAPAAVPFTSPPASAPATAPPAAPPAAAPAAVQPTVVESTKTDAIEAKQETKPYDASATSARSYDTRYSSLEFGLIYYYYDYKEVNEPPPFKSTESGWLPGIYLGYEYKKPSDVYTKIYGHIAGGDLTYDGSVLQTGAPFSYDSNHFFFKVEGDIGYTVPISDKLLLIPYTGYGYRYWRRGETENIRGVWSYKEIYTWNYIPVGVKLDYAVDNRWSIGGNAAVHFMFGGRMTAYLSERSSSLSDLEFDLGNEPGYYVEVPVSYRFDKNWSFNFTPCYQYSEIGKSNIVAGGAYEPASETKQYGVNLGVSYLF